MADFRELKGRSRIAVLDGAVDLTHLCLFGADLEINRSLLRPAAHQVSSLLHGTAITSIIFGQPGSPVHGISPKSAGICFPIFQEYKGTLGCSQLDLAFAIEAALELDSDIINISGGLLSDHALPDPILARALRSCEERGVLVVSAAGNDGCECTHIPAAHHTVLAVGALTRSGDPHASSNWGKKYLENGIMALGEDVIAASSDGKSAKFSGTSFSAALVTGFCGEILNLCRNNSVKIRPVDIRNILLECKYFCDIKQDLCIKALGGLLNFEKMTYIINYYFTEATNFSSYHWIFPENKNSPYFQSFSETRSVNPNMEATMSVGATSMPAADVVGILRDTGDSIVNAANMAAPAGNLPIAGDRLSASSCGCGCAGSGTESSKSCSCGATSPARASLVFALGTIGIDFGSEARRDSFRQALAPNDPSDWSVLQPYLMTEEPTESASLIWTLSLDSTVIYAIRPSDGFSKESYARLIDAMDWQQKTGVDRSEITAVPGIIVGTTRLLSGQILPVIQPFTRGICYWGIKKLVTTLTANQAALSAAAEKKLTAGVENFLHRVYFQFRNLGIAAPDRALNYAATNINQARSVFLKVISEGLELDDITVAKSSFCRPGAECFDVELSFFDPLALRASVTVARFTVDVSDVFPVSVGEVRFWNQRASVPR